MSDPTVPSGFYPPNPYANGKIQSHSKESYAPTEAMLVKKTWSGAEAVAPSAAAVHASLATATSETTLSTGFTNPPTPRNLTITYGGTAADLAAASDVIYGTDADDQPISEVFPASTLNTGSTVTGSKAFKTVTSATLAAHDGTGATRTIGFGSKLGMPHKMERNTIAKAYLGNTLEGTAPTLASSSSVLASNTVTLNSSLNGSQVDLYYFLP